MFCPGILYENRVRTRLLCAYLLDYENAKSVAQLAGAAGFNHRH
jgi:hypothetical protein